MYVIVRLEGTLISSNAIKDSHTETVQFTRIVSE